MNVTIEFNPQGVCSRHMKIDVEDGVIRAVEIQGGCPGNLQAISRLVVGMRAEDVVERLEGIRCGGKPTSCPDQLTRALRQALPLEKAQ
nr:TIGR03905 family TSCPD domain-containing protein [Pseudoflavonifractor sp. 524-17]